MVINEDPKNSKKKKKKLDSVSFNQISKKLSHNINLVMQFSSC